MLLLNVKTTAIAALAALSVSAASAPAAHAWGKKEQGFLAGVVTAVIIDQIIEDNRRSKATPAPAPAPVYVEPRRPHGSIYGTPAAQAFNSYSKSERKAIQRALRAQGYYGGGIDGSFGPGTYNAIVAYARDAGASGNLTTTGGSFAVYDGLLF